LGGDLKERRSVEHPLEEPGQPQGAVGRGGGHVALHGLGEAVVQRPARPGSEHLVARVVPLLAYGPDARIRDDAARCGVNHGVVGLAVVHGALLQALDEDALAVSLLVELTHAPVDHGWQVLEDAGGVLPVDDVLAGERQVVADEDAVAVDQARGHALVRGVSQADGERYLVVQDPLLCLQDGEEPVAVPVVGRAAQAVVGPLDRDTGLGQGLAHQPVEHLVPYGLPRCRGRWGGQAGEFVPLDVLGVHMQHEHGNDLQ